MPKIASNFELGSAQPIDSRLVVENESDLSSLIAYEGLEVYVKSLKAKKMYDGSSWVDVIINIPEEELNAIKDVTDLPLGNAPVPNTGYVDTVYFNTNLNPDEVVSMCEQITPHYNGNNNTWVYIIAYSKDKQKLLAIIKDEDIMIGELLGGNFVFQSGYHPTEGNWINGHNGIYEIGGNVLTNPDDFLVGLIKNPDAIIGDQNANLTNLFSITPYDGTNETGNENILYRIDNKLFHIKDNTGYELQNKLTAGNGISISEDGTISLNLDIAEEGSF